MPLTDGVPPFEAGTYGKEKGAIGTYGPVGSEGTYSTISFIPIYNGS